MRSIKILIFALFLCSKVVAQREGAAIFIPRDIDSKVLDAVNDMAYWLEKMSGRKYAIRESTNDKEEGIHLLWLQQANLPATIKKQLVKDGQSFYLIANDQSSARIIGTGRNSLINGIYTYLQELGFRWYMPGDTWTIIPSAFPKLNISKVYTPDFQSRVYAGSGGVNAIAGTDPKNSFKVDYDLWNRRNRFSTDYPVRGHTGHIFYGDNKKILDANPSWFCNGIVNRYGRIDISKPGVVQLFTEWALKQVKPGDNFPSIGVDPSDGAGGKEDCLPANMPGIKTWSDKYFWLANQVAKNLDKSDEKTQVHLYAYSHHAAPPSFTLEKNVYPILIPYAFQRGSRPEDFIKLWSDKLDARPMGMYDYWNITQWSSGVPQFNIYSIPEKLKLWKQYNVTSINLETTNGKGAMGHALWLASQMMWNTNMSFDSLYNDFLQNCFGPAASDVKKMYDRWSQNYQQAMDVDISLQDLVQASFKTRDPVIQNRLKELKAYVHYLKLYYDYIENRNSVVSYERLIKYIHRIHPLRLVHSSALLSRYIVAPPNYKADGRVQSRPAGSEDIEDIEKQFQQDLRENNKSYRVSDFSFDINRVKKLTSELTANPKHLIGTNYYQFYLPTNRILNFKAGATKATKLLIKDTMGTVRLEKNISPANDGYNDIAINLPAGKYTLSFGEPGRFSRIIFPKDLVFVSSGTPYYDNGTFPLLYIYVPKDMEEIIYEDKHGPGTNKRGFWRDPNGKRVNPEKIKASIYRIAIPPGSRGKVWVLDIGHRSFTLLNIPSKISLTNFTYVE